jgi:F-box interacting protein
LFATCALTVFTVDVGLDGCGAPKILFSLPMDSFAKTNPGTHALGLLEESLVSVGLPSEEIIFSSPTMRAWSDVLKWLPIHSVAPLMRVCKDWHAAIKSQRFMKLHTTLHAKIGTTRPRITLIAPSYGLFLPLEECDSEIHQIDMLKFLFTGRRRQSRTVCSKPCHHLVVGSYANAYGNSWDFICNPTMGYYKQVYLDPDGGDSFLDGRIGLGYDSRMKEHVLVRLVYHERNMDTRDYHLECYVNLTNTESWRPISPPPRPVAEMQSAYADGKLYWMVDPNLGSTSSSGCELLALDISTHEFQVLEGPPCEYDQITSIAELQGSICVMCSDETMNAIDIWMLEGGVWSIGCIVELGKFWRQYPSKVTRLLDVDPMDGRLLLSTGKALGYYDPMTMKVETIYRLIGRLDLKFAPVLGHESLICPYIRVETSMYI